MLAINERNQKIKPERVNSLAKVYNYVIIKLLPQNQQV